MDIYFFIRHFKSIMTVLWRHSNGNYFVFRDAPDVVVLRCAEAEAIDERQEQLFDEARREMELRQRRRSSSH